MPTPRRTKERTKEEMSLRAHQGTKMNKIMEVDVDSHNECVAAAAAKKKTKEKMDKRAVKAPNPPKATKATAPAGDEAVNEDGDDVVVEASGDEGSEVEDAGNGDEVDDTGAGGDEDQIEVSDDGMPLSGSAKRKRRKAITDQLTPQQEDDLCDWYRENTFFYDKMNRQYRNADKKKDVITEKARSLNLAYDDLMKYFASLRMQYGKLKLKKSSQAAVEKLLTHHQLWVLDNYASGVDTLSQQPRLSLAM